MVTFQTALSETGTETEKIRGEGQTKICQKAYTAWLMNTMSMTSFWSWSGILYSSLKVNLCKTQSSCTLVLSKFWVNVLPQSFFTAFGLCKPDETPVLCSQTTSRHHNVESTDKKTDTDRHSIICAVFQVLTFQWTAFVFFHFVHSIPQCTDLPDFYTRDSTTGTQRAGHIQQPPLGQAVVAQTVDRDTLKISVKDLLYDILVWKLNFLQ